MAQHQQQTAVGSRYRCSRSTTVILRRNRASKHGAFGEGTAANGRLGFQQSPRPLLRLLYDGGGGSQAYSHRIFQHNENTKTKHKTKHKKINCHPVLQYYRYSTTINTAVVRRHHPSVSSPQDRQLSKHTHTHTKPNQPTLNPGWGEGGEGGAVLPSPTAQALPAILIAAGALRFGAP